MSIKITTGGAILGTVTSPSIASAIEPQTGFFRSSANSIGYTVAGTSRLRFGGGIVFATASSLFWSSTSDPEGSLDLILSRAALGSLSIGPSSGGNAQAIGISMLTENVIIAAAATSTSVIQLPAGAILLGVTSRVTTIGSASWPTTYAVAVGATTVATGISTALSTTSPGTTGTPLSFAAATAITITPNTTPGDAVGRIRCTIHYIQLTPPTS